MSENPFKFWEELKRRKVVRVITVYGAAAFVIIELINNIAEPLSLPEWVPTLVIVLLIIGFLFTIIISWIFDITPEGIRKTKSINEDKKSEEKPTKMVGWKIATFVSVVIIIGLFVINIAGSRKQEEVDTGLVKSIAVLPFKDFSADTNQEYMCDGLTDEVINHLYKIESFEKVVSLNSVLTYKETSKRVPEIANELGVNYVLEGTYKKIGDQVRVTAQLIEPTSDKHIWQNEYDQPFKEIIDIQIDIAKQIAAELKTALSPEEIEQIDKPATENPEAYDLYLKGRYFWNKRTEEGFKEAIVYFNDAIELDPNYALAYAGLADSYNLIAGFGFVSSLKGISTSYQKAKDAANKALRIDNTLAEAYTSLAHIKLYYDWDWKGALESFERAIQLNPDYGPAHQWYANCFSVYEQHDKAITEAKLARELDPRSPTINKNVGHRYYLARKYDQAIEELKKALNINPEHFLTRRILALSYLQKGMNTEATLEMEKALKYAGGSIGYKSWLGYIYGATGNHDKAQMTLSEIIETSKERYVESFNHAIIYLGLGDNKNAIIWLEKAYDDRTINLIYLNTEQMYDPLRSDPRFIELIEKMDFPK